MGDKFIKFMYLGHDLSVVREESRHREKKGGSQVTARARKREKKIQYVA